MPAALRRELLGAASREMIAAPWTRALRAGHGVCRRRSAAAPQPGPDSPTPCELVPQPTTRLTSRHAAAGGGQVAFVGGGVLIKCPAARHHAAQGDSAERYPDRDFSSSDTRRTTSRAFTSRRLPQLLSRTTSASSPCGNVHARLPSGSTLVGPMAEYRRPSRDAFGRVAR